MKGNLNEFSEENEIKTSFLFWDYKGEIEVAGTFKEFVTDSYGKHGVIEVSGEEIHLPNLTALNGKLANVETGDRVGIRYLKDVKSKKSGRTYSDFQVFIKKA